MKCKLCDFQDADSILSHVRRVHHLTADQYKSKFPKSKLRVAWVVGDANGMESFRKVGRANSERMRGRPSRAKIPEGQWARHHDCCVKCGTTEVPHSSRGLCSRCIALRYSHWRVARKNQILLETGTEGKDYVICQVCQRPFASLTTYGHLAMHNISEQEYQKKHPKAATRSSNCLDKLSRSVSRGRLDLHARRGYLNPISQRMSKRAEMIRKHTEHEFATVSKIEYVVAGYLQSKGCTVKMGSEASARDPAGTFYWQYDWNHQYAVDFAQPSRRLIIEVLGDWWHGWKFLCGDQPYEELHGHVKRNLRLDELRFAAIQEGGWNLLKIWEHDIRSKTYEAILDQAIMEEAGGQPHSMPLSGVVRTSRERWNARWLISSGQISAGHGSVLTPSEAKKLRRLLNHHGKRSAVPSGAIRSAMKTARKDGFPYYRMSEIEKSEAYRQILGSGTERREGFYFWSGANTELASVFHPHLFDCRRRGKMSPVEFFHSDRDLRRGIRKILCLYGKVTAAHLREICRNESAAGRVNNFPPRVAMAVLRDLFSGETSISVLDPCAGFSGRLLGCAASGIASHYTGVDLSKPTIDGLEQTSDFLRSVGCPMETTIVPGDCLQVLPSLRKCFDLVFTSPPFLDQEQYAGVPCESDYAIWLESFVRPLLERSRRCLKLGGLMALYLEKIRRYDFPADADQIARQSGFRLFRRLPFRGVCGENMRGAKRFRPLSIPVWQKL
jgi:G:T-mismatch repair DNA endonuclease (very short patch repair protein)